MIPLRDASRTPVRFPLVTVTLIVVNVLAFVWEVGSDDAAIVRWAVVPAALMRGEGWGAFIGERLVGKLVIDALPYPSLAHTFWLHAVYVHPDARGSGASTALLTAAIEGARARGGTRVALWVNAENGHAKRLYERLGFQESGRIPGGIFVGGRQCDDVLMSLVLS